ncbi:beta-N-acetylhexosaminidase [Halobacillus salinarum]|uniref:Beta-N-acetylhexosaminidase n=1 Tax=Halobacillus salinarum TaxID=2932257 RepID=A0ABY4EK48_9BACI|nr:beta-N-acetylhexosaminidase [Halobacillus salinarum]UOQ43892.1 beta-N-acetylhexosaminidase [Halobacillus salinarum]
MEVCFKGNLEEISAGLHLVADEIGLELKETGVLVEVEQWKENKLEIYFHHDHGYIRYNRPIHFFRAIGLFIQQASEQPSFHLLEVPKFETNGVMLDCSRNAVMKTDQVKILMRKMAVMGLNMLMLYMEDTYEIKEQPYFGYMRGRYSPNELEELDDYGWKLGIEVIPSIQTLAHLSTFLRWQANNQYKDTDDILLAGAETTYKLIDEMIQAAAASFRTNRIHIGMDEAHFLGRGNYLNDHGFVPSFSIMEEHLQKVMKLIMKQGLSPMMWSDMYFRMASSTGDYYDEEAAIPSAVVEGMPEGMQFVYWDYYHEEEEVYERFLQTHKEFGPPPVFAGGIWTWNGVAVNYKKTFQTTNAALTACKREGIQEVFAALWGDDGAETDLMTGLLGMQLYAEHGYSNDLDMEKLRKRFKYCTGAEMNAFIVLGELDQPVGSAEQTALEPENPAKYILWQDPLLGLFDEHLKGLKLREFYEGLEKRLCRWQKEAGQWGCLFRVPLAQAAVLAGKSELGIELKTAYDQKDMKKLANIARNRLPLLIERIESLKSVHYDQWMERNKPFGWEVLEVRYAGLLSRTETALHRVNSFLEGSIDCIPELEEKRLPFSNHNHRTSYVRSNRYLDIFSANRM